MDTLRSLSKGEPSGSTELAESCVSAAGLCIKTRFLALSIRTQPEWLTPRQDKIT